MDKEAGKKNAAAEALTHVEDGMILGVGTGSTAAYFIDGLAQRIQVGVVRHRARAGSCRHEQDARRPIPAR